ncbi:MAG: sigma-70 family RNA polymerase sigma factor [Clostridia bacterium]|nr:sigma-70 family RNA polymerase sigma factor [Clostridia bacterium]
MNESRNHGLMQDVAEAYMEKIFYFCLRKTGNQHEAEDLTADIMLNLMQAIAHGTDPDCLHGWVWQIARNRFALWADKKRRYREYTALDDLHDLDLADDTPTPAEAYIHAEDLSLLRRELAFISADYRQVVVAFYVEDRRVQDIAKSLGLPEGTVKAKLFRARKLLKEGMNMAREFGKRSYRPENVGFSASGNQPSGLPWSAVQRSVPKNILLEAGNNPSTAEELSIALGIAMPYMEEEIALLEQATLLRRVGDRYITDFVILDKTTQEECYRVECKGREERLALIKTLIDDLLPEIKKHTVLPPHMSDNKLLWWLVLYLMDRAIFDLPVRDDIYSPATRANGESWGFMGYESGANIPEDLPGISHNGGGRDNVWIQNYFVHAWGLEKPNGGVPEDGDDILFLGEAIRSGRTVDSLTDAEKAIWNRLNGRFAYVDENGKIAADLILFMSGENGKVNNLIYGHPKFDELVANVTFIFEGLKAELAKANSPLLSDQLDYVAAMEICGLRAMAVKDALDKGIITMPEESEKATLGAWMVIDP